MAIAISSLHLKPEIIEAVKKSLNTKNRLQFELNKSYLTIQRWLNENSPKLTEANSLRIIKEELGFATTDELLTEAEA